MDPLDGLERCFQHTQTLMAMIALKRAIKDCYEPICMVDGAADANKTSSNPFLRAGVWCVQKRAKFLHPSNPLYHFLFIHNFHIWILELNLIAQITCNIFFLYIYFFRRFTIWDETPLAAVQASQYGICIMLHFCGIFSLVHSVWIFEFGISNYSQSPTSSLFNYLKNIE